MSHPHTVLVKSVLLALGQEPDLILWEHKTGSFREPMSERRISTGLVGSPDIVGILGPRGRFFGLECKTGAAVRSTQQRVFHARAGSLGAAVVVVHSVEEARAALAAARGTP